MFQSIYKAMSWYYLKCRKNTESKNPQVVKTKNGRVMLLSKGVVKNQNLSKSKKFRNKDTFK